MNLVKDKWMSADFLEFRLYLDSLAEAGYRDFTLKLIPNLATCRGIRAPVIQSIAKSIQQGHVDSFLTITPTSYEEKLVVAKVIGSVTSFDKLKKYINSFIPYIDNWAVCDSFAAGVRQFAKNLDLGFAYVMSLLSSSFPYSKRLGTVLLLIYYSKEPYMDAMIEVIPTIRDEDYYVKMGVAWLVSTLYIVNPKKTWVLLDGRLDSFIHSKSISKICDSYQVSDQDKIIAKSARKQKNQYKN